MNIYAEHGDKVVFSFPDNGYEHDQENAAKHLVEGATYTVRETDVGDWRTRVYLDEIPGVAFNSMMFEDADDA